ncbi:MAG: type II secretion system F family protein [Pseudomonadota bacterium]
MIQTTSILIGVSVAFCVAGILLLLIPQIFGGPQEDRGEKGHKWGNTPRAVVVLAGPFRSFAVGLLQDMVARSNNLLRLAGNPNGGIGGAEHTAVSLFFGALASIASVGIMLFHSVELSTIASVAVLCPVLLVISRQFSIQSIANERIFELRSTFPYFLEMMVLTLRAGATTPAALNLYLESSEPNALTTEISRLRDETRAGALFEDALLRLADRMYEPDLRKVIMNIKHGMRTGSLADVLAAQAEDIRFVRTQTIEREIERMRVALNLPLVFMLIASLGLIMGPAIVTMVETPLL